MRISCYACYVKKVIMKTFILLAIPSAIYASGETMNTSDHMSLHRSKYRPPIKLKKKMRLHQLHKVDEEQVECLVKELTKEDSTSLKLTHSDNYLIYKVTREHYKLVLNALDGTVIKKELKKGGK